MFSPSRAAKTPHPQKSPPRSSCERTLLPSSRTAPAPKTPCTPAHPPPDPWMSTSGSVRPIWTESTPFRSNWSAVWRKRPISTEWALFRSDWSVGADNRQPSFGAFRSNWSVEVARRPICTEWMLFRSNWSVAFGSRPIGTECMIFRSNWSADTG